jgi:predicted ribosomally synthesized peptide with nif11-like leader
MEERLIRLQDMLEQDKGLGEKLFAWETPEEVQGFLQDLGLEFTIEEIMTLHEALAKALEQKENGELSDEDLEEVAGGWVNVLVIAIVILAAEAVGSHYASGGKW